MFKYVTKANPANVRSKSLRTTIPKEICALLDINNGDEVQWNVDVESNEKFTIVVTKKKDS